MFRTAVVALAGLVLLGGSVQALDVYLVAKPHTVSLPAVDTTPPLDLASLTIESYGGAQDAACPVNGATVLMDGTLQIEGNCWKKISLAHVVTANTILEFDFRSTVEGDIHGIGFDDDDVISEAQTFQLYGTQTPWGIQDFNDYPAGADASGWKHYSIPAGALATGGGLALTFTNDHDVATPNATSFFRNVRILEGSMRDVLMWGYALDPDNDSDGQGDCFQITPRAAREIAPECNGNLAATSPGPRIAVDPAEPGNALRIFLTNMLPEPTSIVIPGQEMPYAPAGSAPVWNDGSSGDRPTYAGLGDDPVRVRSFGREANANGGRSNYVWNNFRNNPLKPGTFLYHSGTIPAKQVQMGLYGAVTRDQDVGVAYSRTVDAITTDVTYDHEVVLVLHEIDPVMHDAVETGSYGTPDYPSAYAYLPQYFMINADDYEPGVPGSQQFTGLPGDGTTLLRILNAGLQTRVPTLQDQYMDVQAEDGNAFPYALHQYSYRLGAGQTLDATLEAQAATTIGIYDRMMGLTNPASQVGGMVAFLSSPTPGALDFFQQSIESYDVNQDFCPPDGVSILDGGATLRIQGNCWKRILLDGIGYTVTASTTIEFDFMSTEEAEIHAIGFDFDNTINPAQMFQVFGTQTWTSDQSNNDYLLSDGWKHYVIAAGALANASPQWLTFANDHDGGTQTGVGYFRNVRICEGACP